ncbi:hypothetical protein Nepgr_030122 [Nepenthes gracilis]|uniref:Uncharacterized protein n=1 Tax=Nepenthes gracilis TaxID=150966 RepID=A0AAD3TFN1_NEPGR|nr:hypothetical protein Nepgr_030122 [Nepenthes gracilis]
MVHGQERSCLFAPFSGKQRPDFNCTIQVFGRWQLGEFCWLLAMSRCFPFRPPGYEKKAKITDVDLLKKEKYTEKKHKKEKKEGKVKGEKGRTDENHREEKDRKEKHRDKKKDKEKDREKYEKNKVLSDETRIAGHSGGPNGEKSKDKSKIKEKDGSIALDEKKAAGHPSIYNGEELSQNSHLASGIKDFKHLKEMHSRTANAERMTSNQMLDRFADSERRMGEGMVRLEDRSPALIQNSAEIAVRMEKKVKDAKAITRMEARPSRNAMIHNSSEVAQHMVEGTARPLENNIDWRMDGKGKARDKQVKDIKGDKWKDKDRGKTSWKDKDEEKEKKTERKAKQSEHKQIERLRINDNSNSQLEQSKVREANRSGLLGSQSIGLQNLPNESSKTASAHDNNIGKREEIGPNVVVYDDDVRPNKMARTSSFSHRLTENRRSLEHCQTSIIFTVDTHEAPSFVEADKKPDKLNGTTDAPLFRRFAHETAHADQNVEASRRLPHPDTEYLSQILAVPKMDEWSDFDDQEWLFGSSIFQSRNSKMETSGVYEATPVWAESLKIDSADVFALPYVIPY